MPSEYTQMALEVAPGDFSIKKKYSRSNTNFNWLKLSNK